MNSTTHIPIFVWFMLAMALIGGIYRIWQLQSTRKTLKQAATLTTSDWQEASALYKRIIVERVDDSKVVEDTIGKLAALYRQHNVDADLSPLQQCVQLLEEIHQSGAPDRQKNHLNAETQQKIQRIVNRLPPSSTDTAQPDAPEAGADVQSAAKPKAAAKSVEIRCGYCNDSIVGSVLSFDDYVQRPDVTRQDIVAYVCPACETPSHVECTESGIRFRAWSGYDKSRCTSCDQRTPEPTVVLRASS